MKKLFAMALSLVLGITMLTGCSSDEVSTVGDNSSNSSTSDTSGTNDSENTSDTSTDDTSDDISSDETAFDPVQFNIASLKGPTTMGMVKLMSDSEKGETYNTYDVSIHGTADEITAGIVNGTIDVANVPCNLASVLYNKTEGAIYCAAINTYGVLYVVQTGDSIKSVEDLKGKTIYSTGKNTTPEYVLNYILMQNDIDPATDVTIEYKSESTEVAAILSESENAIAVLPQPYVTVVMNNNDKVSIALDLTEEWNKVSDSALVTGVVIAQKDFVDNNTEAFNLFLDEYRASTEWVNTNTDEAADLIGGYDIVGAPVAKKALPFCNITFLDSTDSFKETINGYLNVLFKANPSSVGGKLPEDEFYYNAQ